MSLALASSLSAVARAEVPAAPDARGREFRVDFSARHLDVDADLGELLLTGDVVVTVGRYRLAGARVHLRRGPRGIGVEGGGDIAFCSCDDPPVSLGYRSVTIAPPSDVVVERAVLRAGGVPVFWLPYLWLRSPDRLGLMFPSAEWRGDDGLLVGSGVHIPFDSNQGRPALRSLDIAGAGYIEGGARVDVQLLTPGSTSFVRWDHLGQTALTIDAHGAAAGDAAAVWAYDIDASRGIRGRRALTSLEAAARRFDHGRVGVGSVSSTLFAAGIAADGERGDGLAEPLSLGPFAEVSIGGAWGRASSYSFDLGTASAFEAAQPRRGNGETRSVERAALESAQLLGPVLARVAAFEQGEVVSLPEQAAAKLRVGAGISLALPLVRRFNGFTHSIEPEAAARLERQFIDGAAASSLVATAGLRSGVAFGRRGGAAVLRLAGGAAGDTADLEPILLATLARDTRFLGVSVAGQGEPVSHDAEAVARLRVGPRGGTTATLYAAAREQHELQPSSARLSAPGEILPRWHELGALDRDGWTTGGDLTLALGAALKLGAGADLDLKNLRGEEQLLALRSFARYRHSCGCVALGAFGSARRGRGGVDVGVSVDLMP